VRPERGKGKAGYEAVILVENCAAIASVVQGGKVEMTDIGLEKESCMRTVGRKKKTYDNYGREEETRVEYCVERNEGTWQVERHPCLNDR
jgi:hypothetical protein